MSHVLVIDNYDSFTYNLVQAILGSGADTTVLYNDELTLEEADRIDPTHLVISPGPGRPEEAGVAIPMIRHFAGRIPILGVCLGHQAIAVAFGGVVGSAKTLVHGKASEVHHDGDGIYTGVASPTTCGRYHSLAVTEISLPADLKVTARTSEGEVMGIRHIDMPIEGVQFHPESILTPVGDSMIFNFLGLLNANRQVSGVMS